MKTAIIATVITIVIIALCGVATAEVYPATAKVIDVNYDEDLVTVETFNGYTFAFYGCEDWQIDDCVSLIMEDHETEKVDDDEIVMAHYSAWELIHW